MAPKREEPLRRAGWTVRGELRVASEAKGASDVVASLASRFVLDGSASSFVTMFRKALGTSPARYMARRPDSA